MAVMVLLSVPCLWLLCVLVSVLCHQCAAVNGLSVSALSGCVRLLISAAVCKRVEAGGTSQRSLILAEKGFTRRVDFLKIPVEIF